MLSRLQELRKEEETLLRVKAALHDQLNRLKVEELALQSIISSREGEGMTHSSPLTEEPENILVQVDNETSINQTELQLSTRNHAQEEEEEEEEEEESDS
ncbi:snRNA-activating protein complex subunit 5 [Phascolarctos cinereus]|uniref:snRNA-activating protein complex subunit 5 isoform X1 n=1 Tax=Phascolarctos cinereus TaxID=38626 RepID=A0A6P5K0W6_PHACI|nr:snRNA-activating protein complex subunit 5 isoform X1 [Phascolarctos cinereus]XP_020838597.1 snRNA-activating protein complex subunit 5 isoform X2 [Phascolarctos cinereus]